jgi:hypothetical protein
VKEFGLGIKEDKKHSNKEFYFKDSSQDDQSPRRKNVKI